jgi:hypothetical protein
MRMTTVKKEIAPFELLILYRRPTNQLWFHSYLIKPDKDHDAKRFQGLFEKLVTTHIVLHKNKQTSNFNG